MKSKALVATACFLLSIQVIVAEQFPILQCFIPCNNGFTGNEGEAGAKDDDGNEDVSFVS